MFWSIFEFSCCSPSQILRWEVEEWGGTRRFYASLSCRNLSKRWCTRCAGRNRAARISSRSDWTIFNHSALAPISKSSSKTASSRRLWLTGLFADCRSWVEFVFLGIGGFGFFFFFKDHFLGFWFRKVVCFIYGFDELNWLGGCVWMLNWLKLLTWCVLVEELQLPMFDWVFVWAAKDADLRWELLLAVSIASFVVWIRWIDSRAVLRCTIDLDPCCGLFSIGIRSTPCFIEYVLLLWYKQYAL